MQKVVGLLITAVVLSATGGAYWFTFLKPSGAGVPASAPGGSHGGPPPALVVEATAASRGTAEQKINAIGTLASNNAVIIRPEIEGRITAILFTNGTTVEEGQLLIQLDDSILKAQLDDAQAALTLSQQEYNRAAELLSRGAGTMRDRDEADTALRRAEARVALARARLDKATVVAPFSGVIGIRQVGVGEYVTAGKDIVNLEQMQPIKVEFRVPERFLTDLAVGQRVTLNSAAYPDTDFAAEITAIDPRIDKASRSILVQATAPNPEAKLRPGQFAAVTIQINERRDAVFVPEQAVVPAGKDHFIYRVVDGHAVRTPITTGLRIGDQVEVLSGITPGEVVITAGQQKIVSDGMSVTTVEPTYVSPRTASEEIKPPA